MGPDLSHRYNTLTISGFKAEHDFNEVYEALLEIGLPDTIEATDIKNNSRSGNLSIVSAKSYVFLLCNHFMGENVMVIESM